MRPRDFIDEAVTAFGQFAQKRSLIFGLLKQTLLDVEQRLLPSHMLVTEDIVLSSQDSVLLDRGRSVAEAFLDGKPMFEISPFAIRHFGPKHAGLYFATRFLAPELKLVMEFGVPLSGTLSVRYFKHTDLGEDEDVDFPFLDRLADVLKHGLMARVAELAKDVERMQHHEALYLKALGVTK